MTILRAWFGGIVRVARAPLAVVGVYALTLAFTVPVGAMLHESLSRTDTAVDADWIDEVSTESKGLAQTLVPEMIGVAAPLDHISGILDGRRPPDLVILAVVAFFICWTMMLWGGLVTRLSTNGAIGVDAFVKASLRSSGALLALGVTALVAYAIVLGIFHAVLLGPLYAWLVNGELERTAFAWRAVLTTGIGAALIGINQVFDYARIAAVVEQLNARDAFWRGLAIIRGRPVSVVGVVLLNGLCLAALLFAYGAVEFIPGGAEPTLARIVLLGQGFIIGRLVLRLVLAASQIELRSIE